MVNGVLVDSSESQSFEAREAKADVAISAARKVLVEAADHQQHVEAHEQVRTLDVLPSHEQFPAIERAGNRVSMPWIVRRLVTNQPCRDHVEIATHGSVHAQLQVVGLPPVVVIEHRNKPQVRLRRDSFIAM